MASLNLGQDVANKIQRKQTAVNIVANSYPLYLTVGMRHYGSLIIINPSTLSHLASGRKLTFALKRQHQKER